MSKHYSVVGPSEFRVCSVRPSPHSLITLVSTSDFSDFGGDIAGGGDPETFFRMVQEEVSVARGGKQAIPSSDTNTLGHALTNTRPSPPHGQSQHHPDARARDHSHSRHSHDRPKRVLTCCTSTVDSTTSTSSLRAHGRTSTLSSTLSRWPSSSSRCVVWRGTSHTWRQIPGLPRLPPQRQCPLPTRPRAPSLPHYPPPPSRQGGPAARGGQGDLPVEPLYV